MIMKSPEKQQHPIVKPSRIGKRLHDDLRSNDAFER